jgi:hypothetical protein
MADDPNRVPDDCQLQVLYDSATPITLYEKARRWLLRLGSARKRRVERVKGLLSGDKQVQCAVEAQFPEDAPSTEAVRANRRKFREGELVRVKTYEEIGKLMDKHGCTEGLHFMPGMKEYCGREVRVFKRVRAIFDERSWRMLKIKNTYLLEGAICTSRGLYEREGCDRCCFYFWKDVWLEKVEG